MKCQSCGRTSNEKYCSQCTDDRGNLKSFEDIAQNLTEYFVETQGFDREVAKSAAIGVMSRQPAWEQIVRKNQTINNNKKMKFALLITSLVVALSSGGLVFWLTSARTMNSKVTYENVSSEPLSPFENILEKDVDGLQVFEMKCPGDQKIIDISGKILMFNSLEGSRNSRKNKLYSMDLEKMQGYPFEPESDETREMIKYSKLRMYNTYTTNNNGGFYPCYWIFNPFSGETKLIEEDIIAYNNQFYICRKDRFSIVACEISTGKQTKLPYFRSFFNNGFVNTVSYLYPTQNHYEIINLKTGEKKKTIIPNDFSIIGGIGRFMIVSENEPSQKTAKNQLFVYNTSAGKLVRIDDNFSGTPIIAEFKDRSEFDLRIFYLKHVDKSKKPLLFSKSVFGKDEKPELISRFDEEIYPVYANQDCLVYTKKINVATGKWNTKSDDEKALTDLWVRDFSSNKDYQLESGGVDRIDASTDYIVWSKWQGSEDRQFFNICMAELPPQYIYPRNYDSAGVAPYDNLSRTIVGDLEIVEMKCKGDQIFNLPILAYPSVYRILTGADSGKVDDNIVYFTKAVYDAIEIRQYDPDLPMQSLYLFDPKTESGVKVEMNSSTTKRFLDSHNMSIGWTDSSSILTDPNAIFSYDHFDKSFKTTDIDQLSSRTHMMKISMSIRKEERNGKTAVIFNDTSQDHELMVINKPAQDVVITIPKEREFVFTITSNKQESGLDAACYHLDTSNAKATLLGTDVMILHSNRRFILMRNFSKMSSLQLFDKETKEILDINPNLKPVVGNLSSCIVNNSTDLEELVFAWPYPETRGINTTYKIAYSRLSDINSNPKIADIKNENSNLNLVACLGDWILFNDFNKDLKISKQTLYGYNINTNETAILHDNISSKATIIDDVIISSSERGYTDSQFDNICFIKLK